MFAISSSLILMGVAIVAAFACVITVVGAVQFTAGRQHGYFHWVIPIMLITIGLGIALSGRSMEFNGSQVMATATEFKNPLAIWVQRIGTILILTLCAERIIAHYSQQKNLLGQAPLLTLTFIAFWLGSIAAPMFLSARPVVYHDGFYPLAIGLGALLLSADEAQKSLPPARNALFIFLLIGYLLIPIAPALVLDSHYSQGLIPGIPRLAGIAPHAVTLALMSQIALLCLWARPYRNVHLNRAAWILGLLTLLLAQSKTAWISALLCAGAMYLAQHGAVLKQKLTDPQRPALSILLLLGVIVALAGLGLLTVFGNLGGRIDHFLASDSGAQLTSLTGRDVIWATALEEWRRNPLFGYGPSFLDESYRLSLGMIAATHGHNQYMDVLARAGLVGAIPLTFYLVTLAVLSIRHTKVSYGLSLALFIVIGFRAISEVPLSLKGYSTEFIGQLLLLLLLPAYNALVPQAAGKVAPHHNDIRVAHQP